MFLFIISWELCTIATSNPPPKARPSMAATDGFLAAEK